VPELRQLRYAVALAECGTFAAAAEREHITQSALSQQVARLEREWGVLLFARTSRGTTPTAAGARLLPQARAVLAGVAELGATAAALAAGTAGELLVGSPTFAVRTPARREVLAAFAAAAPGVQVRFTNAWSPQLLERLAAGELDLSFAMLAPPDRGLEYLPAQDEPARLVLRADDPLAACDVVGRADLAGRRVLLYPEALNGWLFAGLAPELAGAGAAVVELREPALPAVLEQVRAGDGVFPAVPWELDFVAPAAMEDLVVRPTTGEPGLRYGLWLARRTGPAGAAAEAFWAVAHQVLG
jgi:DNA-binding transcriptional LysR family regulator